MPLSTGDRLGPYEITGELGAGGMGEVYKARDTRLDRTIAIKVLPEHVASDPDLQQRFEREAKIAGEGAVRTLPSYSPNGKWLLYLSNESGQMELYVKPYPELDRLFPVSIGGGTSPWWSPSGSKIFYRLGNKVMAVEVQTDGDLFTTGAPEELFEGDYVTAATRQWHVAPNGSFLMMMNTDVHTEIVLVQNWHQELQRLVPVN